MKMWLSLNSMSCQLIVAATHSFIYLGFRILYQEIDYINEGKNADRFRRDFRNVKWVRVPVCYYLQNLMIELPAVKFSVVLGLSNTYFEPFFSSL